MRDIVEYELGPIPLTFAKPKGEMRSTPKSKVINAIESDVSLVSSLPEDTVRVFDAMVHMQQLPKGIETFSDVSDELLSTITKQSSRVVFFVSDKYDSVSVKGWKAEQVSNLAKSVQLQDVEIRKSQ